jgi:hypothetical protein
LGHATRLRLALFDHDALVWNIVGLSPADISEAADGEGQPVAGLEQLADWPMAAEARTSV